MISQFQNYSDMEQPSTPSMSSDPSQLTVQLVWREVAVIKELLTKDIIRIDEAIKLAHENLVRVPTETEKAVLSLKELMIEKIANDRFKTDQHFDLIEKVRLEQKVDSKSALDAALISAKDAVKEWNFANNTAISKSEGTTQKQIDQLAIIGINERAALAATITDLKDRFNKWEGQSTGAGMPIEMNKQIAELKHLVTLRLGREEGPTKDDTETRLRLDTIEAMFNKMAGKTESKNQSWVLVAGVASFILTILAIVGFIITQMKP